MRRLAPTHWALMRPGTCILFFVCGAARQGVCEPCPPGTFLGPEVARGEDGSVPSCASCPPSYTTVAAGSRCVFPSRASLFSRSVSEITAMAPRESRHKRCASLADLRLQRHSEACWRTPPRSIRVSDASALTINPFNRYLSQCSECTPGAPRTSLASSFLIAIYPSPLLVPPTHPLSCQILCPGGRRVPGRRRVRSVRFGPRIRDDRRPLRACVQSWFPEMPPACRFVSACAVLSAT
jgi:hypothetical protein